MAEFVKEGIVVERARVERCAGKLGRDPQISGFCTRTATIARKVGVSPNVCGAIDDRHVGECDPDLAHVRIAHFREIGIDQVVPGLQRLAKRSGLRGERGAYCALRGSAVPYPSHLLSAVGIETENCSGSQ